MTWAELVTLLVHFLGQIAALLRVLTRPDKPPAVRASWAILILSVPFVGVLLYVLIGETRLNQRIARRLKATVAALPAPAATTPEAIEAVSPAYRPAFARAAAVNGYAPGYAGATRFLPDTGEQIDALLDDIGSARETIHLTTYIWLADSTGIAVAEALASAARRGVTVRVLVDGLGARQFMRSPHWREMRRAGVRTGVAFSFRWPLFKLATMRIDLRNHRKLLVVDGHIAYWGSRNVADPEFRIKAKFAPWRDVLLRLEGPLATQAQHIFATDWITHTSEDISGLLSEAPPFTGPAAGGLAVSFATGPLLDPRGVPDVFLAVIGAARESVSLTTPYFVPGEEIASALRAAVRRGVRVRVIVPRRNDSRFVAHAARSFYPLLVEAGVEIHEHAPGLLHAKTLLADERVAIIGSANLDRRSFELNYENSLLIEDAALGTQIAQQHDRWIADSRLLTHELISDWPLHWRIVNNAMSILSPVL
ncbi:cardiolipin synthase [Thioclava atlantica]|uniref:Cardiolipin synthase n=1 Tax=Thioclava atlantica TaxID=1317124 RepID=A0A085TV48_9RHOB|nr:cardiolipin synthase [Thioclava atlantica]KFE34595.1 phosphatidylserine/phosphatidylglycerophosphate/cardiolipin synthase [Thioclava atlantica]